jgi:hypothetical protein
MKITEATTLAELQAYLATIGKPELTVARARVSCMAPHVPEPHAYHATVYLKRQLTPALWRGGGNTIAEAIEDALGSLRSAFGVTNLAYEPLNCVREKQPESEHDQYDRATGDLGRPVGVSLAEQTERVMATLTPREREVLDQRFNRSATCGACGTERAVNGFMRRDRDQQFKPRPTEPTDLFYCGCQDQ